MIEQGLLQLLGSESAITNIVPNDAGGHPQIYWVLAPKGAKPPYLVLTRVATQDQLTMEGSDPLRGALFQIDCYTDSKAGTGAGYYTARALANAVRSVLEPYIGNLPDTASTAVQGVLIQKDWDMPYEEGASAFVFRVMLEFRVWYVEVGYEITIDGGGF
jgi:hypothetical protein